MKLGIWSCIKRNRKRNCWNLERELNEKEKGKGKEMKNRKTIDELRLYLLYLPYPAPQNPQWIRKRKGSMARDRKRARGGHQSKEKERDKYKKKWKTNSGKEGSEGNSQPWHWMISWRPYNGIHRSVGARIRWRKVSAREFHFLE